jgi:hypothetical protein
MLRTPKSFVPADDQLLETFARHHVITATCACGHERELHARPIQQQLGRGVLVGKVRDCLRCHKCQKRRPVIKVSRMPR